MPKKGGNRAKGVTPEGRSTIFANVKATFVELSGCRPFQCRGNALSRPGRALAKVLPGQNSEVLTKDSSEVL